MVVLNPSRVEFAGAAMGHVTAVTVDRVSRSVVEEWSDDGPFARFVDVPERRTVVKVVQEVVDDDLGTPEAGAEGELRFVTGPNGSDARRTEAVVSSAVVTGVTYQVSPRAVVRTVSMAGVSADGVSDPVSVAVSG